MKSSTGPGSTLSGEEAMQGSFDGEVRTDPGTVVPGELIGRYVVLRRLGRGAMGQVFAAYDPQLDRRIALKLLNAEQSSEPATAEARAMARLSHPNVVTVHDVSEFRGRPLIAMELVEGTTLGEWLKSEPKLRAVVDAFVQAGRGLAAAHAAGMIHRDFKPANVLVEVDPDTGALGRVRVGDFGLAVPSEDSEVSLPVAGTPRYMAPEQFGTGPVTPFADQFSFCVALHEAVYGEDPFEGTTPMSRAPAVLDGDRRQTPSRSDVPRRVRDVLERGLSVDPQRRFASMDALLEALTPSSHRRSWLLTATAVGLAGLCGWALAPDPPPRGCESEAFLAFPAQRRSQAKASLESHGLPEGAWARLESTLDAVEQMSNEARRRACAAHESRELPDEALFAQLHCLALADAELDALLHLWEDADERTARSAKIALNALSAGTCSSAPTRSRHSDRDLSPQRLRSLVDARANILALQASNRSREALAAAEAVAPDEMEPSSLKADLLRLRGIARHSLGALDAAESDLWQSIAVATEVGAHNEAALAWIWLIQYESVERERPSVALKWRPIAEAHAGDDPYLRSQLLNHVGGALFELRKLDEAEAAFRRSLESSRELQRPPPYHEALLLNNLGSVAGD